MNANQLMNESSIEAVMPTYLAVLYVITIIVYIICMIPYFRMAGKVGIRHAWLCFVPLFSLYIRCVMPKKPVRIFLTSKYYRHRSTFFYTFVGVIFLGSFSPVLVVMVPGVLSVILSICCYGFAAVYSFYYYYVITLDIFDMFSQDHSLNIAMTVLSLFIPLVMVIYSFILCGREPVVSIGYDYGRKENI